MSEWRFNKRGTLFGVQEGRVVREDFASFERINPAVTDAGLPVPVLFGTRYLTPVVVGWAALANLDRQSEYYVLEQAASGASYRRWSREPQFGDDDVRTKLTIIKMLMITARLVLCAGGIDTLSRFTAGNLPFIVTEVEAPSRYDLVGTEIPTGSSSSIELRKLGVLANARAAWRDSKRFFVSQDDADLFGSTGGIGFPYPDSARTFTNYTRYSEFWFSDGSDGDGRSATHDVIDKDSLVRGVSSLFFDNFNFGGASPFKKWSVAATRIDTLTQRVDGKTRPTGPTVKVYKRQWQPHLAKLTQLQVSGADSYYMIIIDRTLSATYLSALKDYILALPFDEVDNSTTYRVVLLPFQDCEEVRKKPPIGYKIEQYSYSNLVYQPAYTEGLSGPEHRGKTVDLYIKWERTVYWGRAFWRDDTFSRLEALQSGVYSRFFATDRTVYWRQGAEYFTGGTFSEEALKSGIHVFTADEIENYPIQYPFSYAPDIGFNRSVGGVEENLSVGMGTFNLTTSREQVGQLFDRLIRTARQRNVNSSRFCRALRDKDGEFIVGRYAGDIAQLTRGGNDIRLESVVIFATTPIIGSTGPEAFFQFRLKSTFNYYGAKAIPWPPIKVSPNEDEFDPFHPKNRAESYIGQQLPNDRVWRFPVNYRPYIGASRLNDRSFRDRRWLMDERPIANRSYLNNRLREFTNIWMQRLKFPTKPPVPPNAPPTYISPLNDVQFAALQKSPPEVKVFMWDLPTPRSSDRLFNHASKQKSEFDSIDSNNSPIEMSLSPFPVPVNEVIDSFGLFKPFGWTMNPIHALRECLTNPDWGEGIPENKIDEATFMRAAQTCFDEKLDFCYVHSSEGGVNQLITAITDYIDGVVYYEPQTDKVVVRLIRDDYDPDSLLVFNETNISVIHNYLHQYTDEPTNSITIRFHEAAKGSTSSFTVHDVDAGTREGVVATTLNYDGCATQQAAATVAVRELNALSRSLISFTADVDQPENYVFGLGQPLMFSYRDLGIDKVVMRVSSIDYGDGTTGGVTLQLLQDPYSYIQKYDPQVDAVGVNFIAPPELPFEARDLIKYLEAGWTRLTQTLPRSRLRDDVIRDVDKLTINQRYLQAGVKYSPETADINVFIGDDIVPVCIGTLLSDVPPLPGNFSDTRSGPQLQSFVIVVRMGAYPNNNVNYVRIGDEVMATGVSGYISRVPLDSAYVVVEVAVRGVGDTIAKAHKAGTDVWFLDEDWLYGQQYQRQQFDIHSEEGDFVSREVTALPQDLELVGRLARPLPPWYVLVNGCHGTNIRANGDLVVKVWTKYNEPPWTNREFFTLIKLTYDGNEIINTGRGAFEAVFGADVTDTLTIPATTIQAALPASAPSPTPLKLTINSEVPRPEPAIESWQTWEMDINWLPSGQLQGWNYNWGGDWDSSQVSGWDYDWDQTFGD